MEGLEIMRASEMAFFGTFLSKNDKNCKNSNFKVIFGKCG